MTGIADDYFEDQRRRDIILHVLFVWAAQHKTTSYRQGMHEIAGPILFVLEQEMQAFQNTTSSMSSSFSTETLEAHSYYIFEKIMDEMEPLYDPTVSNKDEQPQVVHFCANLQENLLRQLDPLLCDHLEQSFIQSQIYGMRWARLILGREFPLTCTHCFRIWDYVFACTCSANVQVNTETKIDDKIDNEVIIKSKTRYSITTPMLIAVGNFMLAMLLHIRKELIEGDDNTTLSLLMHYPEYEDITPILDLADMIRRGVLIAGAHTGVGTIDDDNDNLMSVTLTDPPPPSSSSSSSSSSPLPPTAAAAVKVPSWLGSTASSVGSAAASKLKSSASSVLHAASSALKSSRSRSTGSDVNNGVERISSPTEFKHVQHGTTVQAKEMLGQPRNDSEFLSSPVDLTSTKDANKEASRSSAMTTTTSTTTSSSSLSASDDGSLTHDPFGHVTSEPPDSSDSTSTSIATANKSKGSKSKTRTGSATFGMSEMEVFSSSTSTVTGARIDNSEKTLSAMSLLLDEPVSKTSFNPTRTFCNGVADRFEDILDQLVMTEKQELDNSSDDKMPSKEQLKSLVDVLRGRMTLVKYDDMFKYRDK